MGNVRAVISKTGLGTPLVVSRTDYYPFGMPMPNRNVEGNYRYGYQGQYAEKEPELGGGINSFQLRLWDSRIGRWLSPDPMHEFFSPYLGMGNNPISLTDPTGGCTDADGNPCVYNNGSAFDFEGNSWSMVDGVETLNTPIGLGEVFISSSKGGYMAYVNQRGGTNHSFLLDPVTGDYWEASHPIDDDGNVTHGFNSWISGDEKSIIRKRNLADGDFWDKDAYLKPRTKIEVYFVYVPDKKAAINYADNNVGEYPYNFTTQNCKHFAIDVMRAGHAKIPNSTALPREFAKPGQSYWGGTTLPDKVYINPNN